jgi:2-keto-4-pentenoate hydratase
MSESTDKVQRIAQELYRQHKACEDFRSLPPDLMPTDFDETYLAQDALMALYLAEDKTRRIGGYKVALTSQIMQEMLGVTSPAGGLIRADQIYSSGVTLPATNFVRLGVESEIAMRLDADLGNIGKPHDGDSVASAVACCMAAIELIEDRNATYAEADKRGTILCGTADLSWNRGCVLGPEFTNWRDLDLRAASAQMLINGEVVGEGKGEDVLGDPMTSLAWVANHLLARGRSLKAGDIVMTGSVVRTNWLKAGDEMRTQFDVLGDAVLHVS